jgi:RimJ/RimL family protein N-acetyltransferase
VDAAPRLGPPVDWRPAQAPRAAALAGAVVRLEPLDPGVHGDALWDAGSEEAIWEYLPYGPFATRGAFDAYLGALAAGPDPLAFAIVDIDTGAAQGVATYLRIEPEHGVIEIGHIWLGRSLRRTRGATEAIFLLARNAFDGWLTDENFDADGRQREPLRARRP